MSAGLATFQYGAAGIVLVKVAQPGDAVLGARMSAEQAGQTLGTEHVGEHQVCLALLCGGGLDWWHALFKIFQLL